MELIMKEKRIETITKLYSILSVEEYKNLIIQSKELNSISRRYWSQPIGIGIEPDTTLRQLMFTSIQVYQYFNKLKSSTEKEKDFYYLMILDRERGIIKGGPNKLTISERVEFYNEVEGISNRKNEVKLLEEPQKERDMHLDERFEKVRMWGWLDTESEVEEIREIKRKPGSHQWDLGDELIW